MLQPKRYIVEYIDNNEVKTRTITADKLSRVLEIFFIFEKQQPKKILNIYKEQ